MTQTQTPPAEHRRRVDGAHSRSPMGRKRLLMLTIILPWSSSSPCFPSTGCCGPRCPTGSRCPATRRRCSRPISPGVPSSGCSGFEHVEQAQAEGGSGAAINFWLYLRNSVIVSVVITVGQVFFCAMAAYAFARMRFPGRDKIFALFLAALMIPPHFHDDAELPAHQAARPAEHLCRHHPAVLLHDAVRDLLPAAVLPRHQSAKSRRPPRHRRRRTFPDLLEGRAADEFGAGVHAGRS